MSHRMLDGAWAIATINVGTRGQIEGVLERFFDHVNLLKYPHRLLDIHCAVEYLWISMSS